MQFEEGKKKGRKETETGSTRQLHKQHPHLNTQLGNIRNVS
jgi:hypothetical protein